MSNSAEVLDKPLSREAYVVETYSWRNWTQVASVWDELCRQSGASFFLTADWVENWLSIFGQHLEPEILVFRCGDSAVGACLIARQVVRIKGIPFRRVFLNCSGEPPADGTCIEYNRLLCLPGHEQEVSSELRAHLAGTHWDEFVLPGMELGPGTDALTADAFRISKSASASRYVDLVPLRQEGKAYESTLSSNTRQQIRRSLRFYEELSGPVAIKQAATEAETSQFFNELIELHQKSWVGKGERGAFSSEKFLAFHRRLIERTFSKDGVHLLRVSTGSAVIGVLYCFFHRGRVYFYQSGFSYHDDNRSKPGLLTHFLAINHYLSSRPDAVDYDFLAGDSQYKRSLAKQQRLLEWIVVQRPTLRVRLVEALRRLKKKLK